MANVAKSEINHQNCIHTWQRRLGHRDPNAVKRIDKEGLATGIHIDECSVMIKCEHYVKRKSYTETISREQYASHKTTTGLDSQRCVWSYENANIWRRKFVPLK